MQRYFFPLVFFIFSQPYLALANLGQCGDIQTPLYQSISQIQGRTFSSPYVGKTVITEGVVTQVSIKPSKPAVKIPASRGSQPKNKDAHYSGFWLQQATQTHGTQSRDHSQGIFIYHSQHKVKRGDKVRLLGRVAEYHGLTEIKAVKELKVCAEQQKLPEHVELKLPVTGMAELEALEGMRIKLTQELVVSDLFGAGYGLGNYGQFAVSSKLHFQPTELFTAEQLMARPRVLEQKKKDYLLIDDGSAKAFPDFIPFPNAQGFSATNPIRVGDTVKAIAGVLHAYDEHYVVIPDLSHYTKPLEIDSKSRPKAPVIDDRANLVITSFNLENYFNGKGKKSNAGFPTRRGAKTYSGFELQSQKIVAVLSKIDADIISLMELENDGYGPKSAIADLTRRLNQSVGKEKAYAYINPQLPRLGQDEISVGILYRQKKVLPQGIAQVIDFPQGSLRNNSHLAVNKRPSLAQLFLIEDKPLLVVSSHLKSKGRPCPSDSLRLTGSARLKQTLQGHCNQERRVATQFLSQYLKDNYREFTPTLLLGDFNSYSQEEPLLFLYQAGYKNLKARNQFSYSYQGYLGNLDHALANKALLPYVLKSWSWNINSVEDVLLNYQTEGNGQDYPSIDHYAEPDEFRSSDHDPILIELKF